VIRLTFLIFILFFLSNCSFSEKSRIWNDKEEKIENQNIKKLLAKEEKKITEFNPDLKLDLSKLKFNNTILNNQNNFGAQTYDILNKKIVSYKFSKIEDPSNLNYKPLFLSDGLIFFDKKGAITRYNNSGKVIWKKNHYSKSEKKLRPKLFFALDGENLLIADSIAKYYSINIKSGEAKLVKKWSLFF
jgi:outer membrane protein assembly factor BamB